jgi:hypothetical protein
LGHGGAIQNLSEISVIDPPRGRPVLVRRQTYNPHQVLILLLLKKYLSEDYRDTVELIEIMDSLREKITLDKAPISLRFISFSTDPILDVQPLLNRSWRSTSK